MLSVAAASVVALGAVVSSASPAFAKGNPGYWHTILNEGKGTCLDADAQQQYNFGAIIQWNCSSGDLFQQWNVTAVGTSGGGQTLYSIKNVGSGFCLDNDAQQVYDGGSIIQWSCNWNDYYQLWTISHNQDGSWDLQNYGAGYYNGLGVLNGPGDCLDADYYVGTGQVGSDIQYDCSNWDYYQSWIWVN